MFSKLFENVVVRYIACFVVSMIPIIEIRGSIGMAVSSWHLNIPLAAVICILGNMLPVPFIYFFARRVLEWGADKKIIGGFFRFCLRKGEKGGHKLMSSAKHGTFIALMLFVGIPLPGTGAWTGTLAASLLELDFKKTVLAVCLGVVIAGTIMGLAWGGVLGGIGALLAK